MAKTIGDALQGALMMMRFLTMSTLGILLALAALTHAAAEQCEQSAIRGVIDAQMDAFYHGDHEAAFAYAAPEVQAAYGHADRFAEVVRQAYAPVYRPLSVAFFDLKAPDSDRPVQVVHVLDAQGKRWEASYQMARQQDGSWRIAGVALRKLGLVA